MITQYRHRNPDFPDALTADQFFDENQFESYRALGQRITVQALKISPLPADGKLSFAELEKWFTALEVETRETVANSEVTS